MVLRKKPGRGMLVTGGIHRGRDVQDFFFLKLKKKNILPHLNYENNVFI